jgi:hypothetical protein
MPAAVPSRRDIIPRRRAALVANTRVMLWGVECQVLSEQFGVVIER